MAGWLSGLLLKPPSPCSCGSRFLSPSQCSEHSSLSTFRILSPSQSGVRPESQPGSSTPQSFPMVMQTMEHLPNPIHVVACMYATTAHCLTQSTSQWCWTRRYQQWHTVSVVSASSYHQSRPSGWPETAMRIGGEWSTHCRKVTLWFALRVPRAGSHTYSDSARFSSRSSTRSTQWH